MVWIETVNIHRQNLATHGAIERLIEIMAAIQQGRYLASGNLLLRGGFKACCIAISHCGTVALSKDKTSDAN